MTSFDDMAKTILRNKRLGRWAAEQMGITGRDADADLHSLAAMGTTRDPERSDVFSKIRKDFDAAGVAQADEQALGVMTEFTIKAGKQMPATRGVSQDSAAVMLARNLMSP